MFTSLVSKLRVSCLLMVVSLALFQLELAKETFVLRCQRVFSTKDAWRVTQLQQYYYLPAALHSLFLREHVE